DPIRLPAGADFQGRGRTHERQRQHWRDQRGAQVSGTRSCDPRSRRRQRAGCGSGGAGAVQRAASATDHDHGGVLCRARPSVPGLAQVPRRQGSRHHLRGFYFAHPEIHFVHGDPVLADRRRLPLRLARIGRRSRGFSAAGMGLPRIRRFATTGFDRRSGGARHLETPAKHWPSRQRNGIQVWSQIRSRVRRVRSNRQMSRIAIIGGGAWGTGLAMVLGRKGTHQIRLWANEPEVVESITNAHINQRFLPGFILPESIAATSDLPAALEAVEIVVSVMPSQHCRALFERMAPALRPETLFVSCTKGLEDGTLLRMTEVIADVLRNRRVTARVAALSGPSFAKEVARGDPTAVTVASIDGGVTRAVQQAFNDSR